MLPGQWLEEHLEKCSSNTDAHANKRPGGLESFAAHWNYDNKICRSTKMQNKLIRVIAIEISETTNISIFIHFMVTKGLVVCSLTA